MRLASRADALQVTCLLDQLGYASPRDAVEQRLAMIEASPRHAAFVADDGEGRLVGVVAVEQRLMLELGERAEIVALIVDAHSRRGGVGRRLLEAARQWAHLRGNGTLMVRSNVQRAESHLFYERQGFRRIKTQHVYELPLGADAP